MNLSHSERSVSVESSGRAYHVRKSGAGDPIMLLHGFTGSAESWEPIRYELAESFTVIRPDLPGHGLTHISDDITHYQMGQAAAAVIAILDALDIEQVGLHGYSMGGRLALYTALEYPNRIAKLSLESASPGIEALHAREARRAADEALAARIIQDGLAAFVADWERMPLFKSQERLTDALREWQRELRMNNAPLGLANSLRGMGTGVQPSLWPRLSTVEMPVLLLTGQLDEKFTAAADEMARHIPHAVRIAVRDAGHSVYLDRPQEWLIAVRTFFKRIVRR